MTAAIDASMQQISSQEPVTISLGTTGNMAFSRVGP